MRKLTLLVILLVASGCAKSPDYRQMASTTGSQITLDNLDTMAVARSNINANFTELYAQAFDVMLVDIAALTDPGGDRIAFWDDSAGEIAWLSVGTGLTITLAEMTASSAMTWPTVAGIPYWTSGTAWGGAYTLTSDIDSGSVATEIAEAEAVYDALELKADAASVAFNMGGSLSNLLFTTGENFLDDAETDTDHVLSASKILSKYLSGTEADFYGVFVDPDAVYQVSPDVTIISAAPAAFTITEINVTCDVSTALVFTFKSKAGGIGFGTPTTIDVVTTSAGIATETTITDGAVAEGEKVFVTLGDPDDALLECAWKIEGDWD